MADAVVTFVLENVKKLIMEQTSLINGAEGELKQLENDLALMNASLIEHSDNQEKGPVFIEHEKQIREAVYDAEDALDSCLTLKARSNILHKVDLANKVKELRLKLDPTFARAMSYFSSVAGGSAHIPGTSSHLNAPKKTPVVMRQDNVVGFADEEATLIKYLNEKTEQLDVISIVGMPGLGKTTLAYKIYRDPNIEYEFPVLIWVYVSQEFNAREVFLAILKKFTGDDMSGKDNMELVQLVRHHLERGRFLLFMDDVWTVEDWGQIEAALPKDNKLGKVLITSRHERVAKQTNRNREPHKLRFMTFAESWELLELEVFGKGNTCPEEMERLGRHIATQCGGVPLAVVVIGGTLSKRLDKREWERVSDSVSSYVQDDKRTENIISLSYNKLPHNLKDCFLYLGMFPEDTEISAWKLTRLWIAEGFIQEKLWRSLEEVAEDNLGDLVARNLVMAEKTKANGDIKTCRVHDMIREFCQNEAAFAKKNLFQEVKRRKRHGVLDPAITEIKKRRRLCIHSNVALEFLRKKPRGPGVRSFVCFSKETISLPTEHTESIPNAFDLLRVVDATSLKLTKYPAKLTNLIHLRYIALSGNEFKALPKAISELWNLQTVKIDTMSRELEVKADISKMVQLRHLKTKAAISLTEVRLRGGGGENLQTLSRLSAKSCTEDLFDRVSNLKNLGIRGNINTIVDATYLGKLEQLEKLKLVHDTFSMTGENVLHRFPHPHNLPPNLRMLTLSNTHLAWTQMTTLGRLHSLEVLKLKEMAFKGGRWETQSGGFPDLETLHIARADLEIWIAASDEPFPKLKNLILKNCEGLQEIPSAVGKGKSLQFLEIERVSPTLVQSAKKIEKEKQEMQGGDVRTRRGGFKLKTSPGDAPSSSSTTSN